MGGEICMRPDCACFGAKSIRVSRVLVAGWGVHMELQVNDPWHGT